MSILDTVATAIKPAERPRFKAEIQNRFDKAFASNDPGLEIIKDAVGVNLARSVLELFFVDGVGGGMHFSGTNKS